MFCPFGCDFSVLQIIVAYEKQQQSAQDTFSPLWGIRSMVDQA